MVLKLFIFLNTILNKFENDVKMYGTQASACVRPNGSAFENDVKMYGTQAGFSGRGDPGRFENDVKMYGTQADTAYVCHICSLRMM